jgi:hypothetical protein
MFHHRELDKVQFHNRRVPYRQKSENPIIDLNKVNLHNFKAGKVSCQSTFQRTPESLEK